MNSFYSEEELQEIGFKSVGVNVLISRKACIYSAGKMSVGNNVRIDDFCILSGCITLGNNIHISAYTSLFAGDKGIYVSDYATISSGVVIYAKSDDYSGEYMTNPMLPEEYTNVTDGEVRIEKHVIIGTRCVILPNVKIGTGTAVGAMSLVNKDLEEWGMYVGIPCRFLRERSKRLLELEKEYAKHSEC